MDALSEIEFALRVNSIDQLQTGERHWQLERSDVALFTSISLLVDILWKRRFYLPENLETTQNF